MLCLPLGSSLQEGQVKTLKPSKQDEGLLWREHGELASSCELRVYAILSLYKEDGE